MRNGSLVFVFNEEAGVNVDSEGDTGKTQLATCLHKGHAYSILLLMRENESPEMPRSNEEFV